MARTHLLLFTEVFPFGLAEAFLEPEIGVLATAFERVTVVPRWLRDGVRPLPVNVAVDDTLARAHESRTRLQSLSAVVHRRELFTELLSRPQTLLQPAAGDRLVGHLSAAVRVAEWLEHFARRTDPGLRDTLCYTYWLWVETAGAGLVRRTHPHLRLVSRAHGYDLYAERHAPAYIPMQRFALQSADAVFAVSEDGRDYLRRRHPSQSTHVAVARLGTAETASVCPPSGDGVLRILTCARLEEVKRLDLAVQAVAQLTRVRPELRIEWTHFGGGKLEDRIARLAARELPANAQLQLRGEVPNHEVREHYRAGPVDLLLSVSASEGVPVSMMEALSFGVPVVATAVGGVPEIVSEGCGLLVPADASPSSIAAAIGAVGTRRASRAEMRARCRARWEELFQAEANYREFVAHLRSVQ